MLSAGFKRIKTELEIQLSPIFINRIDSGIDEYLQSMVPKYISELGGVIVSFRNVQKLQQQCLIRTESPYLNFKISVELTLFAPKSGQIMIGIVNKVSPDHIGCLVNGFFNVSIAKDQFATNYFKWDNENHDWKGKCTSQSLVIKPGKMISFSVLKLILLIESLHQTI